MLLIQGGTVKPISGPDLPNGQVLIDNGKIVAVGTNLEVPEGTEVYHAEGCLITPGLMDAHTHIGLDEEAIRWEGAEVHVFSDSTYVVNTVTQGWKRKKNHDLSAALKEKVKEHLEKRGFEVKDFGCYDQGSCDYPDFGRPAAKAVAAYYGVEQQFLDLSLIFRYSS